MESRREEREEGRRGVVGRERVWEFLRLADVERARSREGVVEAMLEDIVVRINSCTP